MSKFRVLITWRFRKGSANLPGCSRAGWCSPLQISLVRDLPEKSIGRAYTALHAYRHDRGIAGSCSHRYWDGHAVASMYAMLKNLIEKWSGLVSRDQILFRAVTI